MTDYTKMKTRHLPITPLNFHSEIRIDTMDDETSITVYNCDIKHIDLLIMQLQALKAEAVKVTVDVSDEPAEMTAVLGKKPDPTAWYGNALRKVASQPVMKTTATPAPKPEPTKYFTCAETAKFVRDALKEAFPTQKFSVRSKTYSGGASITIGWLDGVTEYEVNQVVQRFSGADFDGMIDLKSNVYRDDENGKHVNYGADYIFCNRDYSPFVTLKLAAQIAKFEGIDTPNMNAYEWFDGNIQVKDGKYFTNLLNEARFCYSVTAQKYIGGRFGYLPQWIECMVEWANHE